MLTRCFMTRFIIIKLWYEEWQILDQAWIVKRKKKKKKKVIWDNNSSINVYIQRKLEERIYFKLLNFKILRSFDKRETFTLSLANYNLRISPKTVKTSKFSCDDHISTTTNQLINQRVQGLAPATVHATYRNDQYRHSTTTSILISRR